MSDLKTLSLRFSNAAKAADCVRRIEERGYNYEPVRMAGEKSVTLTFKAALEAEVMAIIHEHGGYVPQKPTPLWPGGHPVRDRD